MGHEDDERLFWHIKAIVLVNLGRNEEAVELFQEGWISPSSNSNVAVLHTVKQQGDILARTGQPQGAADRYHWVACDMNSNHNAKEAIALYSKAITTAPTNGSSYFSLISCLQEKGQDEAALEICEKGLQAIPNHDLLYLQKADILRCLGQKEAAILSIEKACQCNSNNEEEIHHKKGELLYIYGEYEAAIRCFNESIEIISKKLLGKEEELKKKYSEAHNLEKDRREIYHDKGLALYVLKRFEEAIACFDITNQPESRDLFTLSVPRFHPKGRALAALGKYEQAISCFDDALEDDVTNFQYALISLYKGELLSKMGKEQEALDCFEQAEYVVHYFPPKTSLHQNDIDIRFRYGVAFPSQEREILCKHLFEMQQAVVEVEAKKLDETVKKLDKLKEEKNTLITEFIQRVDDYSRNITSANYELRKKLADMKERILNLLQNQSHPDSDHQQTGTEQESKEKFKMDQIDSDKGPKQWVEVGASDRSACCNLF